MSIPTSKCKYACDFYLAGAGGDARDEAAGSHLLVEEGVQHAVGLALGKLALHVVGLGDGLWCRQGATDNADVVAQDGAS